jgi:hypothetical protein
LLSYVSCIGEAAIATFALAASVSAVTSVTTPRAAVLIALEFTQQVVPVGKGPGFIAIANVNHDGRPDLLVANTDDGTITVLLGDGKGGFTPAPGSPFPCNANPNDIAVADMTGNGNLDLVIANHQTPYITISLGDGRGGFKPSPHSPFATLSHPHPHGLAIGDFVGDGKPAVVTDSWGSDQILLMPSDGKGNLILPGKFFGIDGHSDQGVRAAHFTKSGKLDIITTGQNINAISLLLGDGKGGFRKAPGSPFPAGAAPGLSRLMTSTATEILTSSLFPTTVLFAIPKRSA